MLSFWFGEDAYFGDAPERMSDGEYMKTKSRSLWYAGTSADAACMPFVATIEAAASGALDDHPAWSARPDGDFARVILFDQLARNCFRGTPRAFAFDDAALDISRRLCADENIIATAHPAVVHFLTSPLMHSETLADHDLGLAVNDALATRAPQSPRWDARTSWRTGTSSRDSEGIRTETKTWDAKIRRRKRHGWRATRFRAGPSHKGE